MIGRLGARRGAGHGGTVGKPCQRIERALSGWWYVVSKPGGTNGKVEVFWKLECGVRAFCGRQYVVLGPRGVQDVEERLKNLASMSRARLADDDTSSPSLGDP